MSPKRMSPSALTLSIPQPPTCFLSGFACSGCLLLGSVCLAIASVPVYLSVDVSGVVMFPRMGVSISSTCVVDLGWFALKSFRMNGLVQVIAWMPYQLWISLCGLHLTFKELVFSVAVATLLSPAKIGLSILCSVVLQPSERGMCQLWLRFPSADWFCWVSCLCTG